MKIYDVIVLGGGASGCIASIFASKRNKKILIIDQQNKLAKKILVTGNGRCNLTNLVIKENSYNQNIKNYLKFFDISQTLNFFNKIGLEYYVDEEKRVYPLSNSAKSVTEVLLNQINKLNIEIKLDCKITQIKKEKNLFYLFSDSKQYISKKLVVATGGNTFFDIIEKMNINIKKFYPSLVSIKLNSNKNLANIRLSNVEIKIIQNKNIYKEYGEILFKDGGISGISIFNLSSYLSRTNDFSGKLSIDLLPKFTLKDLISMLKERKTLNIQINKFFDGLFVKQIAYEILNRLKINENRNCSELSISEIESMAKLIKNLSFDIKGFFDNNQVFSGGVNLEDLTSSLESKKIKNLYFCGEICNVDGQCGGYNLQWAWTSGKIVGENI